MPDWAQTSEAASNYYGTDTYTQSLSKFPQNLYIGKLGSGTSNSTAAFNTAAAQLAGFYSTYEYWGLFGSGQAAINGYTPYNWGVAQANSAIYYWHNSQYAYLVGGRTIFGDVEAANAGWSGYSQSDNRNTLNGYLDTIAANGFTPGVYVAPDEWFSFFGQTYRPTRGFVFWITKCQRCLVCAPCGSCNTTIADVNSRIGSVTGNIVGGTLPVVWQYWISACHPSCGDYDASIQSPSSGFSPRTSGTTWSCSGCGVQPCL